MVLEENALWNWYKCKKCKTEWKDKKDWFEVFSCPKCQYSDILVTSERQSIYDIEMAFESNRDYSAFFIKNGKRITRFDCERRLNAVKVWLFAIVQQRSSKRRFKRFR